MRCGICRREMQSVGKTRHGEEIWCCDRCDKRPKPKRRARIIKRRPDR